MSLWYHLVRVRQAVRNRMRLLTMNWSHDQVYKTRVGLHFLQYFLAFNGLSILMFHCMLWHVDPETGEGAYVDWSSEARKTADRVISYNLKIGTSGISLIKTGDIRPMEIEEAQSSVSGNVGNSNNETDLA